MVRSEVFEFGGRPVVQTLKLPIRNRSLYLGIKPGFADDPPADASPQQWADRILATHGKGTDDALVLVARYLGAGT